MVSSLFQIVIGFSGVMGFLLKFIGPLTICPTIALVGLPLFNVAAHFAGIINALKTDIFFNFLTPLKGFSQE